MSYLELFASAIMTSVSVSIGSYITFKIIKKKLKQEAETWLNSETGQKALYSIGAMIAQGAKDSIPFVSKGGKFKWQDILVQVGLGWAKSKGLIPDLQKNEGENPSTNPETKMGL